MTPVVLMAGGRGLRLHPLTDKHPKPMLKVGGKPILEEIIDSFSRQGFKRFWLCVNYKANLIESYFGNGESRGIRIKYIHEETPLGTAGALRFLPEWDVPFVVSNADILANIEYGHLMDFHASRNVEATVCAGLFQYQVPYGVVSASTDDIMLSLREKPIENFSVNAGIYVLEPKVINQVPDGYCDMTDLLERVESKAVYPISGHWMDVGNIQDYSRAQNEWRGGHGNG